VAIPGRHRIAGDDELDSAAGALALKGLLILAHRFLPPLGLVK
jgi:hypothetical protein